MPLIFRLFLCVLAGLSCLAHADDVSPEVVLDVQAQSPASASAPVAPEGWHLRLGAGYPDLRVRGQLWGPVDGEFKTAFDGGVFAYSARLYWTPWSLGGFNAYTGAEGGLASFSGVEGLEGSASFGSAFAGAEWRFARRWALNLDVGPAVINVSSSGLSRSATDWVLNTALYWSVF